MRTIYLLLIITVAILSTVQQSKAELFANPDTAKTTKEFKKGIDGMLKMAGKGTKVYVECADSVVLEYANKAIKEWRYWKIEEGKENADFILQIKDSKAKGLKWEIYAVFISPAGKEIYKTKPSQKFGVGKLKARELSTKYLVNNIIRPFFEL